MQDIDVTNPLAVLEALAETDFTQVDTSFPNLAPGQYEFRIGSAEYKDSESGGKYLLFGCNLVTPDVKATDGTPVAPGYPVRHMINLTPSQKQIAKSGEAACIDNIKKDIAKFLEAVTGPQRKWDPTLESYRGMNFFAKTRVSKERTDERTGVTYSPQTEFAGFIPKTDNDDSREVL
jgi:hypothetical protein